MKYIKAILLVLLVMICLSFVTALAYNDVDINTPMGEAIDRLTYLNVVSGYNKDRFGPNDYLTREQFAKIAITATGLKDTIGGNSTIGIFADVRVSDWSSGYINTAAKNKLITGDNSGNFMPKRQLTYAEALTVALRMLGYTTDDLGSGVRWPSSYVEKANELGLTEGISLGVNQSITRGQVCLIVDRALLKEVKSNEANKYKLITKLDHTISDEAILLADSSVDKSLLHDEIYTSNGKNEGATANKTYRTLMDCSKYIGFRVKFILDKEQRVARVMPVTKTTKTFAIQNIIENYITYWRDGKKEAMFMDNESVVFYKSQRGTFESQRTNVKEGSYMISCYANDGVLDYSLLYDGILIGPEVARTNILSNAKNIGSIAFDQTVTIIRNGFNCKLEDIKKNDVVYMSKNANTLYVYDYKVTGNYENAYPSKALVKQIKFWGYQMDIGGVAATEKLGDGSNSFKYGDLVTLLLGKDNKVVDVIAPEEYYAVSLPPQAFLDEMQMTVEGECVVLSTYKDDSTLTEWDVKTNTGTYKKLDDKFNFDAYINSKVHLITNKDKKIVSIYPVQQTSKTIIIDNLINNEFTYYENNAIQTLKLETDSTFYYDKTRGTLESLRSKFVQGSIIKLYYKDGVFDYAILTKAAETVGPFTVKTDVTSETASINGIDLTDPSLRIIREGYAVTAEQIKMYDIGYYYPDSKLLMFYDDKITGIYDKALPSKANVTSITLAGGTTYEVEGLTASLKLGETVGAYQIGNRITLLLGKDGKVADVVELNEVDVSDYGLIINARKAVSYVEDIKGRLEHFVKVLRLGSGETVEYKVDKDYSDSKGKVMYLTFENGLGVFKSTDETKVSGVVNKSDRMIGGRQLVRGAKLYEILSNETGVDVVVREIQFDDLSLSKIDEDQVVYAKFGGDFQDVQFIVFKTITKDSYQYGVLLSRTVTSVPSIVGQYKILMDGQESTMVTQGLAFTVSQGPVGFKMSGNSLTEMFNLVEITASGSKIEAIDENRVKVGGSVYKTTDDVQIYLADDSKYVQVSKHDLSQYSTKRVRLFADSELGKGGIIRTIYIYTK